MSAPTPSQTAKPNMIHVRTSRGPSTYVQSATARPPLVKTATEAADGRRAQHACLARARSGLARKEPPDAPGLRRKFCQPEKRKGGRGAGPLRVAGSAAITRLVGREQPGAVAQLGDIGPNRRPRCAAMCRAAGLGVAVHRHGAAGAEHLLRRGFLMTAPAPADGGGRYRGSGPNPVPVTGSSASSSRRSVAGSRFRLNPSATMSSRLRWHTSSDRNMTASSRPALRGSGASGWSRS